MPVTPAVAGAAEILGIDPMYVANEGKLVAFVAPEAADAAAGRAACGAGLRGGGRDRRGADRAAGDGAGGDELRRPAGDGPAGGRPAAADLLRSRGEAMASTAYDEHRKTEAVTAHVLWMTTGPQLRGRLRRHDLGHQSEPRGHHPAGDPRHAQGGHPQPGDRLHERPGVRPGLVRRRGGQARPVRARHRGLARQRGDQRRRLLDRLRRQPRRPASPSP